MEGNGMMNWIRKVNNPQRCHSNAAWEEDENSEEYHSCTLAIAESVNLFPMDINKIQEVCQLGQNPLNQMIDKLWLSFENMTFTQQQDESMDLAKTLDVISELHKKEKMTNTWTECSENWDCAKAFRRIILQLKLIQLGYYGPYGTTAGVYLAHQRKEFGAYFRNSIDNNWPHQPLSHLPNQDEYLLDKYMKKLTEALSDITNNRWQQLLNEDSNHTTISMTKLKNVSILDFPAFGSRLSHLNESFIKAPNWPLEVNFAILNKYNRTELGEKFRTQKHLIKLWATYMDYILSKVEITQSNYLEVFQTKRQIINLWATQLEYISKDETSENRTKITPAVADIPSNPFDFTKYIDDDFLTFVQVYMQSHLTGRDNQKMSTVWIKAAEKVFGATLDDTVVQSNGLFNKLFLDCSFKEPFMAGDQLAGCDLFQQSLTSNGLCFSFNSETPSNIWDNSFSLAKVIEEFGEIKPRKFSNFAGTGSNEGKFDGTVVLIKKSKITISNYVVVNFLRIITVHALFI